MKHAKWTERKFEFEFPPERMREIIERLQKTTAQLQEIIKDLPPEKLKKSIDGKWSIQEHIGHLGDLEELHDNRIDDFMHHKKVLQAADMSNSKTHSANHNQRDVKDLIADFNRKRIIFIRRLELLDEDTLAFQSLHPRLNVLMRPVDLAFFAAEHDDHHLASMRELKNKI